MANTTDPQKIPSSEIGRELGRLVSTYYAVRAKLISDKEAGSTPANVSDIAINMHDKEYLPRIRGAKALLIERESRVEGRPDLGDLTLKKPKA